MFKGLSSAVLAELQDRGLIADAADIYRIQSKDLLDLPRWGEVRPG